MAKAIAGLRKVCLYDPDTGDRIVFNKISATSEYTVENVTSETGTGVTKGGRAYVFNVAFFDLEAGTRAQMETWENDGTQLRAVGLFASGALFWNVSVEITGFIDSLAVNARDGVSPYRFNMEHTGFDSDIVFGINILRAMMKRNADGRTQYDQTVNYEPLRATSGGAAWVLRDTVAGGLIKNTSAAAIIRIPFPFPDAVLNVSVDTSATPSSVTIRSRTFALDAVASETFPNDGTNVEFQMGNGAFFFVMELTPNTNYILPTVRVSGTEYVNA